VAFIHASEEHAGEVEITVKILGETEKAVRVDDGVNQFWLPKSKIKKRDVIGHGFEIMFLPQWLARDKKVI
jgi:hypothetical protein